MSTALVERFSLLTDLARHLAEGSATSGSLVNDGLRLADSPAAANVFIERFDTQASISAAACDTLRASGAASRLTGIPISVKANFDVGGRVTTAGSNVLASSPPAQSDAAAVRRLKREGMIVLGHTNMTELAFSGLGLNPHFGTPLNPAFTAPTIPGGSSAGAAVSVALGICAAAIGTDTGGSVRIPAAMCGLVGFKSTADAISRVGVLPLSKTLDSVGVIARSVEDCAILFDVLKDFQDEDGVRGAIGPPDLKCVRVGVIANYVHSGIEDVVSAAFDAALRRLSAAGAIVVPLALPELDGISALTARGSFSAPEAYATYQKLIETGRERVDPRVLERLKTGGEMTACDYIRLQSGRRSLAEAVTRRLLEVDVAVMPTIPVVAPAMSALADDARYHAVNGLVLRNPTVVNLIDGCAITLPCEAPGAPPVGLSLVMGRGSDARLLRLATGVERALATF